MKKFKDLTGQKFGKLKAISRVKHIRQDNACVWKWKCICDCGKVVDVPVASLRKNGTKSCGCLHDGNPTHGMTKSRIYQIWKHMKSRCYNKNNNRYNLYGARGIQVCDKWLKFDGFYEDMKELYSDELSLERINVNGNYELSNCKWATILEQANNKRNNIVITLNDKTDTLQNLCRLHNLPFGTVKNRIAKGLTSSDAFTIPITKSTKKLTKRMK